MTIRGFKDEWPIERDGPSYKIPGPPPGFKGQYALEQMSVDFLPTREPPPKQQPLPTGNYIAGESELLNFILQTAPRDTGTSETAASAAWSAVYLYDMIAENERPPHWIASATTKFKELADWLYLNQWGGPGKSTYDNTTIQWGAFNRSTSGGEDFFSEDSAIAGVALLRAYQHFGDQRYLEAARACAWFLRSAQCGDLLTTFPSSTDAAGSSRKHWGMWTRRILLFTGTYCFDHRYLPGGLIGYWFLSLFKDEAGDETIGSSTSGGTTIYDSSRAALISVAMSEALAFWTDGAFDVTSNEIRRGFSSTDPSDYFNSYPSNKGAFGGSGAWSTDDFITILDWSQGLMSLHAILGVTALVADIYDWFLTVGSNTTFELDDDVSAQVKWQSPKGSYDPTIAPATFITLSTLENNTSFYDLSAAGMLAAISTDRQRTGFTALKDEVDKPRPTIREFYYRIEESMFLTRLGICGLSFQPYTSTVPASQATTRTQSVKRAAQMGWIYREKPKTAEMRGSDG